MTEAARTASTLIGRSLGLIPQDRFIGALERAEADLVRRRGKGLAELLPEIERDRELYLELAGVLCVGETYFLRHAPHFAELVRVVERRLGELPPDGRVRIWSAGCSSGEEPYSIAIALHSTLGDAALARVSIVATDVDPRAIAKAGRARYTAWSFRGAPPWLGPTYFRPEGTGMRLVHPAILSAVTFEAMPLASRAPMFEPGSLDVVFFRNVAIYLVDAAREELHRAMRGALRDGGLLVQGPSDPHPDRRLFALAPGDGTYCCFLAGAGAAPPPLRIAARTEASPALAAVRPTYRPPALARRSAGPADRPAPLESLASRVGNAPRLAPVPAETRPAEILLRALEQAERGRLEAAMRVAEPLLRGGLGSATARVVRGQIFLAARDLPSAIDELRSAVYLDPEPILARYWYASALHTAHRDRTAYPQLRELERRLRTLDAGALLEDGETSAGELLASVELLMEAYE